MDINVIETETNQNQELITNIEEIVSSRERVNSLKQEANDNIRIFNNCILTVNMRREEIVDYFTGSMKYLYISNNNDSTLQNIADNIYEGTISDLIEYLGTLQIKKLAFARLVNAETDEDIRNALGFFEELNNSETYVYNNYSDKPKIYESIESIVNKQNLMINENLDIEAMHNKIIEHYYGSFGCDQGYIERMKEERSLSRIERLISEERITENSTSSQYSYSSNEQNIDTEPSTSYRFSTDSSDYEESSGSQTTSGSTIMIYDVDSLSSSNYSRGTSEQSTLLVDGEEYTSPPANGQGEGRLDSPELSNPEPEEAISTIADGPGEGQSVSPELSAPEPEEAISPTANGQGEGQLDSPELSNPEPEEAISPIANGQDNGQLDPSVFNHSRFNTHYFRNQQLNIGITDMRNEQRKKRNLCGCGCPIM